ncbi:MAG: hypothetical protein LBT35_02630 [Tannerella sp.]|jgi:hypothetical protein|nr:hypothetical protein [Tannerella sp.]
MKTRILLIIGMITVVPLAGLRAQEDERKHEFSIGAGMLSTSNVAFGLGDVMVNAVAIAGDARFEEQTGSPVYHLGYKYCLSKRIGLGATLTAGTEKAKGVILNQYDGDLKRFYSGMAIESSFNYVNRKSVKVYGLAGIGLLYIQQAYKPQSGQEKKQSLCTVDFQITPIGIKVGSTAGGYLEAGFGYKGIVSCGVFCRF